MTTPTSTLIRPILVVLALVAVAGPAAALAGVDVDARVVLGPVDADASVAPEGGDGGAPVTARVNVATGAGAGGASGEGPGHEAPADGGARDGSTDAGAETLTRAVVEGAASPGGRAVAGVAAFAGAAAAKWALMGMTGMYARISRTEVLDNRVRDRVFRTVRDRPGLSVTEIQAALGLGWGTTVYHLDRLERNGYVTSTRAGLARRYFAAGALPSERREGLATLKRPQLALLASRILQTPGLPQGEIAADLGLSKSAAAKQLAELERAGLVTRAREGRVARVHATEALERLLDVELPPAAGARDGAAHAEARPMSAVA